MLEMRVYLSVLLFDDEKGGCAVNSIHPANWAIEVLTATLWGTLEPIKSVVEPHDLAGRFG